MVWGGGYYLEGMMFLRGLEKDLVLITYIISFVAMGRKATTYTANMYTLANDTIQGMEVGDIRIIRLPSPNDLAFFRKYLSEIAKRGDKKFTTKTISDQLHIMRVKYSNIIAKKVE